MSYKRCILSTKEEWKYCYGWSKLSQGSGPGLQLNWKLLPVVARLDDRITMGTWTKLLKLIRYLTNFRNNMEKVYTRAISLLGKPDSITKARLLRKKRFFEKSKDNVPSVSSGLSPSKRLNMRSECITQLDKWFNLKERGEITAEQYKEVQDSILSDIKIV